MFSFGLEEPESQQEVSAAASYPPKKSQKTKKEKKSRAVAKEISVVAAGVAVLSELDDIF